MESTDSSKLNSNVSSIKELLADFSEEKVYEYFSLNAWNMKEVVESFEVLKEKLGLAKKYGLDLYRGLRMTLGSPSSKAWKARDMLKLLEKRATQSEYMQQKAATGVKVFIIGAGPIGLRLAVDCVLLGAEAVVVEKRTSFSRNNVLHLWPFTIEDLRQLGAKKFYGKFCAGAIDHISIRSLQCILLKVALLLGVKFYSGVEFLEIQEPDNHSQLGWHAKLNPSDHVLNLYEFDVLVGADGARKSRVPGFDRKELRGKLALAITANFRNYFTSDEAAVQEISGVAFIFNQKFFKDLKEDTDIDLENIVYYKDDTHYFVMTAKKDSLLRKGVLMADYPDAVQLLHRNNIHMESLYEYAREAAGWSTELPKLDYAVNHHNKNDVALFDFTSIHQAEYAAQAINRGGKDLYLCLIGDALLEPFWPTGTGCARGFLSAMDTAWLIKRIGQKKPVLEVLCERESIFQRLPQTTPENLISNIKAYTIDPKTRYPNLHLHRVQPVHVVNLYDTDETLPSPSMRNGSIKVKRSAEAAGIGVSAEPVVGGGPCASVPVIKEEEKENVGPIPVEKKRRQENAESSLTSPKKRSLRSRGSIHLAYYAEPEEMRSLKNPTVLLHWLQKQVEDYGIKVTDLTTSWSDGMALCALIYRYQPELIPNFKKLSPKNPIENNELAFSVAEENLGISRLLKAKEMKNPDKLTLLSYLSLFYEYFLDADPASPSCAEEDESMVVEEEGSRSAASTPKDKGKKEDVSEGESKQKKMKKRRSFFRRSSKKKLIGASPSSADRSWNTKSVTRDTTPSPMVAKTIAVQEKQSSDSTPKITRSKTPTTLGFKPPSTDSSDFCYFCSKRVYLMERMSANGFFFHRTCFRCSHCNCQLKIGGYSLSKGIGGEKGKFFCSAHYRQLFLSNPEAINYQRAGVGGGAGGGGLKSEDTAEGLEPVVEEESKNGLYSPPSQKESTTSTDEENRSSEDSQSLKKSKSKRLSLFRSLSKKSRESKSESRSRSSSVEGEGNLSSMDEEETHRTIVQQQSSVESKKPTDNSTTGSNDEEMEIEGYKLRTAPSASVRGNVGLVQRLSMGFEQLEANARDTEIQTGVEGRERAKSMLTRQPSGPVLQPFEISKTSNLTVIQENVGAASKPPPRPISPARWKGQLRQSRLNIEDVPGISRGSQSLSRRPNRKGRGQKSISRPLIDNYDTSDVAIQEKRKQQRRFRDAQLIQREMSQLERQYDELEEVGRDIEQALRDAEDTKQETTLMKSWLGLVNERNGLVRKTSELSLRMKELELEDRQYEIDKKLSALSNLPDGYELNEDEMAQFEELCNQKIKIVEERDELVNQTEEERLRELEEDYYTKVVDKFSSEGQRDSDDSDEGPNISQARRASAPVKGLQKPDQDKSPNKRKSWWSFGKN